MLFRSEVAAKFLHESGFGAEPIPEADRFGGVDCYFVWSRVDDDAFVVNFVSGHFEVILNLFSLR